MNTQTNTVSKPANTPKPPATSMDPRSERILAEEEFKLIQRLILSPGHKQRALTFCALEPGNGCSWVVSRLGRALARMLPQSVCIVDADFRSPAQHRNFALNSAKGFAQSLVESGTVRANAQQVTGSNLWVLPAGGSLADPYRLLLSEHLRERIEELRKEFDYVLIDSPAASTHADASLIAKWTDGVVLVASADTTKHQTALRVRENMAGIGIPIVGAILNKRTYPIPDFIYERL